MTLLTFPLLINKFLFRNIILYLGCKSQSDGTKCLHFQFFPIYIIYPFCPLTLQHFVKPLSREKISCIVLLYIEIIFYHQNVGNQTLPLSSSSMHNISEFKLWTLIPLVGKNLECSQNEMKKEHKKKKTHDFNVVWQIVKDHRRKHFINWENLTIQYFLHYINSP